MSPLEADRQAAPELPTAGAAARGAISAARATCMAMTRSELPFGRASDVAPTTCNAPPPAAGRDSASAQWRVTPDGVPYATDLLRFSRTTVVLHVRRLSDKIPSAPPSGWAYYTSPGVTCLTSAAGQVPTLNVVRTGELRRSTEVWNWVLHVIEGRSFIRSASRERLGGQPMKEERKKAREKAHLMRFKEVLRDFPEGEVTDPDPPDFLRLRQQGDRN